jgi:hypothetical protein
MENEAKKRVAEIEKKEEEERLREESKIRNEER